MQNFRTVRLQRKLLKFCKYNYIIVITNVRLKLYVLPKRKNYQTIFQLT